MKSDKILDSTQQHHYWLFKVIASSDNNIICCQGHWMHLQQWFQTHSRLATTDLQQQTKWIIPGWIKEYYRMLKERKIKVTMTAKHHACVPSVQNLLILLALKHSYSSAQGSCLYCERLWYWVTYKGSQNINTLCCMVIMNKSISKTRGIWYV